MTVSLSLLAGAGWQFFDDNGNPLSGGLLYTYEAGTTTPQTTYTDSNGNVANANPIVLDAAGRVPYQVWLTSQASYKFILKTSTGVMVWSEDDVPAEVDFATLAASSGSSLIGFLQAGTGAVARTVQSKLRDVVSVKDFGAVGDGVADDTVAIQAALDAASFVIFPEGNYKITASLNMNDGNFVQGAGRGLGSETATKITATHNGAVFKGKAVTPASGTNVRRYNGGGRDIWIYGPGSGLGASVALDMRGCTMFKWNNMWIQNINTGVLLGGGYSSYYNEFYGCDIDGVVYGYYSDALGNENLIVGGRINNCTTGTRDADNSHNKYVGLAIEVFTNGHFLTSPATQYIQFIGSRVENVPSSGTAFVIDATSQDTLIDSPAIIGVSSSGLPAAGSTPNGVRTTIRSSECFAESGGTARKQIRRAVVNQAIASLSAGASRQDSFTISGVAVGDSVSVTLPNAWPGGLNCSPPIIGSGVVYLQLHNPTGGAISMSAQDFVFEISDYT